MAYINSAVQVGGVLCFSLAASHLGASGLALGAPSLRPRAGGSSFPTQQAALLC